MTAFVLGLSVAAGAMAWHFGFTRGVRIGRALEQEDAKAKRDARFRQMLADIRNPHPLCSALIRVEAPCLDLAIQELLERARTVEET